MDKTFNAAEAEPRLYAAWDAAGAFKAGANASRDETFCILLPPPNVTGVLHMGHAFNQSLMDILIRWKRMQGVDTLWQPGLDHAGIATQMVVERELAKTGNVDRRTLGREAFVQKVWEWKEQSGGMIVSQSKRLGASMDWSREAFTMSGHFHDAVIKVFVDMYEKDLIYRGKRLVNWDPHFETAISDLEVEQTEVDGHMWRLRYPLEDGATYEHPIAFDEDDTPIEWETRDYLTVATTRPETMLGDTGVAVHPDDRRYAHLIGKTVRLPLVGRSIPIVADEYADPEKGTGAVKITPAHDFNDWDVGQRTGLRAINVMTTRAGMWLRDNPDFADGGDPDLVAACIERLDGADRYEARDAIVTLAEQEGWLDGIDADRHMVPHGDRSKTAIEPYLTDQWFVDTAKIVGPALDAVRTGETEILPEQDKKVYFNWLENIEPWCISRQLWWGHQIPVWYGPLGTRVCAATEADAVAEFGRRFDRPVHVLSRGEAQLLWDGNTVAADDGKATGYEGDFIPIHQDEDVLDTWFSSGLWPIGTLGWPNEDDPAYQRYFPTSVLITGFDIIFFWVARMMMMQYAVVGQKPFDTVYVHALVRDERGKKMSKSLGNVLDPIELIDEYGADAVRFTMASMAAMGRDLKLSPARIAGYRNFGTKLWNAARFAEMNGVFDGHITQAAPPATTQTLNRWIIGECGKVRETVDQALAAYRFNDAANALYSFVWGTFCDWYIEFSKPLLSSEDAEVVAETRAVMGWALDQCLILLHPFMPFVTEEIWSLMGTRPKMLIHGDWPEYGRDLIDAEADREMTWVIHLIEQIRSVRGEMGVPVGLRIPMLQIELDAAGAAGWARNAALIERLARIESLTPVEAAPKGAVTIAVPGGTFALPLADVIDIAAEQERIQKSLAKLEKDMGGLKGRLGNPKFVASAPEDVVEETRDLLAQKEEESARLRAALSRLAEVA